MQPIPARDAVTRLGGVARTADVERLSSRARVRTALRRGELVRVGHGRLGLPALERAVRAAAAVNGYLSHVSAALHHGWGVKHVPDLPQLVLSRRNARQREPAHFIADVHVADVPPCDRDGWATSPLRTVLDCARGLPFSDALCVADSALRHGAVTPEELVAAASRLGPRVRRVVEHADAGAANPFESALRALCLRAGIGMITQYEVTCGGLTMHPDLANPLLGLAVEADSYTFHGMEPRDHERDCTRYNALVLGGWTVLRFTWAQVMESPEHVVAVLGGWLAEQEHAELSPARQRHAG